MIPKPLDQISLVDLEALRGTAGESKTIEYKRIMPASNNEGSIKFLRAVCAFANTSGGDLLLGIDEDQGIATAITGLAGDIDAEKRRLLDLLGVHLEPRVPRVEMHAIACAYDKHVLIVRTYRSWLAPHRVKINDRFYGRNAAGTYALDVGELRAAFLLSDSVADRIRGFRADRLIKIANGETPIRLKLHSAMVVHVIPLSTFADGRHIDVVAAIENGHVFPKLPGRHNQGSVHAVNLDGFLTCPPGSEAARAYAQVFRTGAIEGVYSLPNEPDTGLPFLDGPSFEHIIVAALRNYLLFLNDIDIVPPIFVFLAFCNVRNCRLRETAEFGSGYYMRGSLQQDTVALPEIMIDSDRADVPAAMKLTFDTVWNAFGLRRSNKYNAAGIWIDQA